jgi:hypothetical protein
MDDFSKYESLRDKGYQAREVYQAAQADGLDLIVSVRLLRKLFGLTLVDAKKATGMLDVLVDQKQKVFPGAIVYWEGSTSEEGFYIMEARVIEIVDGNVNVEGRKKYRITGAGLDEVPVDSPLASLPIHYFDKTLADRISESAEFWGDLSETSTSSNVV